MAAKRKRKRFLIIALLAIIIAEAGYILYSFGLFFRGGTSKPQLLTFTLDVICRAAGGNIYMCRDVASKLVSAYPEYRYEIIRIVDFEYIKNITYLYTQALKLLNISKPLVDVYYIPQSMQSSKYMKIVDMLNKTLNGTLTLEEFNIYPISNLTIFTSLLLIILTIPKYFITPQKGNITSSYGNTTISVNITSKKLRIALMLAQVNLTFTKSISGRQLEKYLEVLAEAMYKTKNKTETGYGILRGTVVEMKDNSIILNIAALYLVHGNATLLLKIGSPILKYVEARYYIYRFDRPLILVGDKYSRSIKCLIFNYRSVEELEKLLIRCFNK